MKGSKMRKRLNNNQKKDILEIFMEHEFKTEYTRHEPVKIFFNGEGMIGRPKPELVRLELVSIKGFFAKEWKVVIDLDGAMEIDGRFNESDINMKLLDEIVEIVNREDSYEEEELTKLDSELVKVMKDSYGFNYQDLIETIGSQHGDSVKIFEAASHNTNVKLNVDLIDAEELKDKFRAATSAGWHHGQHISKLKYWVERGDRKQAEWRQDLIVSHTRHKNSDWAIRDIKKKYIKEDE